MNIFNPFEIEFTLRNFTRVTGRSDFWPLVLRTFAYATFGAGLATLVGLWAALALRRPFPGRSLVRALIFVPYVVPLIAATFLWRTILAPQYGSVNAWLTALFGTARIDFLGARSYTFEVFGMSLTHPHGADHGDPVRGLALLPVRLPVHPGAAPGRAEFARGGGDSGWRHGKPALPLRHRAGAAGACWSSSS